MNYFDGSDSSQRGCAIRERYELADPIAEDMVECQPTREGAFEVATKLARRRGTIVVYDRMARVGKPNEWHVDSDGLVHVVAIKAARP